MIAVILAALVGLVIGSFLNVCIYRLPRDGSVVRPRSYCPACRRPIAWFDNIPVLSYLLLGGRCRHCGAPISLRYPGVELATAALFACAVWMQGLTLAGAKLCVFASLMMVLIFADLEARILPDEFTLGGIGIGLAFSLLLPVEPGLAAAFLPTAPPRLIWLGESALGAGLAAGALWLVGWLYEKVRGRPGLGLGDVKMVGAIGAFLGLRQAMLVLLAGSLMGSVIGLGYILLAGKDASRYELPYGSFLGAAALATAYFAAALTA
jgi:leader peptidase (prepilin peptidase)/N-methyltransferase